MYGTYLKHHGILGMHWGKKNGPPYPLGASDHSTSEKKAGTKGWTKEAKAEVKVKRTKTTSDNKEKFQLTDKQKRNLKIAAGVVAGMTVAAVAAYVARNAYVKEYVDDILKAGTKLNTITDNASKDVTGKPIYAAINKLDRIKYKGMYGGIQKGGIYGNKIYDVTTKATSDIKVASRQSAIKTFESVFKKDAAFNKTVIDNIEAGKSAFMGKKQRAIFEKAEQALKSGKTDPKTMGKIYDAFNVGMVNHYGYGNEPQKFFDALKAKGYGAIRDINDMKTSGYNTNNPYIVFDNITKASQRQVGRGELLGNFVGADLLINGKMYLAELGLFVGLKKLSNNSKKKGVGNGKEEKE